MADWDSFIFGVVMLWYDISTLQIWIIDDKIFFFLFLWR